LGVGSNKLSVVKKYYICGISIIKKSTMKKDMLIISFFIFLFGLFFYSCEKEKDPPQLSTESSIIQFIINNDTATITDNKIKLYIPDTSDISNLSPIIEISEGASILPNIGDTLDFTNPVIYTVTAEDSTTKTTYTVTISYQISELEAAQNDYNNSYIGTKAISINWTGNVSGCNAGDISSTVRNNVIKRVNYFRRMVGLPDNITLNTSQSQKCQEAALYMIANHTITHYPNASKNCYTTGAADAAEHGNLAVSFGYSTEELSNHSVNAVTGYIKDPGAGNEIVGHRSWVLSPKLSALGTGSCINTSDNNWSANCLMWGDNLNGSSNIEYVAYPPNGYIPSCLVFPRWSFSVTGANFDNANITVKDKNGNTVNVNVIARETMPFGSMPDSRIVWEPAGNFPDEITEDTEYSVIITGVANAPKSTYDYTVKIFYVTGSAKNTPSKENNAFNEFL